MTETIPTEKLDRLRAGLYDHQSERRERWRSVAGTSASDGERDPWRPMVAEIEALANSSTAVNNQLRLRRRQVLGGHYRSRSGWLPRLALVMIAGVAVVTAATVIWQPVDTPTLPTAGAPTTEWNEIPDLANNVDLYHWMENRSDVAADQKGT